VRIYVAGKFEEYKAVQEVQMMARGHGHIITYDWTVIAERQANPAGATVESGKAFLADCAQKDWLGVKSCHTFIGLWHPEVFGTIVEFGIALAYAKELWLVGDWRNARRLNSPFFYLPNVRYHFFDDVAGVQERLEYTSPTRSTIP